jgi:hypothetical protein
MKQTPSEEVTRAQSPDYVAFRDAHMPPAKPTPPTIVVPKLVAPPTPEQVNAVSPEVVKSLQTGAFDPNLVPTVVKPVTTVAVPMNPLDGTQWVRQTKGCRVVLKFTKDRLEAEMTLGVEDQLAVTADYALGRDGLVFGVVTDASSPQADQAGEEFVKALLAVGGEPYCFRVRTDGDTLTLRDVRCRAAEATYAVLGAYKKVSAKDLEKLPQLPSKR